MTTNTKALLLMWVHYFISFLFSYLDVIVFQRDRWGKLCQVWHLWSERRALDMTDKALEDSYSSSQAMRCIHVGLLCVQDHDTDRPTMPDVIFMLSKETDLPQPKQPFFTFERLTVYDLPHQSGSTCSMNEVTTSILHGR